MAEAVEHQTSIKIHRPTFPGGHRLFEAVCSCGWYGPGKGRDIDAADMDAQDHEEEMATPVKTYKASKAESDHFLSTVRF